MIFRNIFLSLVFMFFQSCMIAHYEIRNELKNDSAKSLNLEACDIKYILTVGDGYNGYKKELASQIKKDHILFSKEVFKEYGCSTSYVENKSDANFFIEIQKPPFLGASGLDYLNVFSFGLIPSWETREYHIYSFDNKKLNIKNVYYIDYKNYNHLVFLPFFWTVFFTVNEERVFKKSLRNFIQNS